MQLSIEVIKGIQQLLETVPAQPGVPSSVFVGLRIQKGLATFLLHSTVSVEARVKTDLQDGFYSIDRRILFPFWDSLVDGCKMTIKDGDLLLESRNRKAKIKIIEPNWSYGAIDWKKFKSHELPEDFLEILSQVRLCATDDPVNPEINCVYVEFGKKSYVFSTNDLILCTAAGEHMMKAADYWAVPIHLIDIFPKLKPSRILVYGHTMGIRTDFGSAWADAPEKAWKEFPAKRIKNIIVKSRKMPTLFSMEMPVFVELCDRFARYLGNIPKQEWALKVDVQSKTEGQVSCKTSYASFSEAIKVRGEKTGSVELNLGVIKPVFSNIGELKDRVMISQSENSICYMRTGQFEFMVSQRV